MNPLDIYKIFENQITELLFVFEDEIKQTIKNKILEYQVEEFKRNANTKTFIHRVNPVYLYDVYIDLDIELATDELYSLCSKTVKTKNIQNLFKESNFITIIGTAGSGKSTLTKHLVINSIEAEFKIPIKIELRNLNTYPKSLTEYIEEKIFKLNKIATSTRIIDKLLSKGLFVIIFDGYDEIDIEKKEEISKNIEDISKVYSLNYYLLTSRPYSNAESLTNFSTYYINNLDSNQIEQFIRKQLHETRINFANIIIESIKSEENRPFKSFLSNPLLLSMFILTYQTYINIPPSKSTFYWQVFETLYSFHDSVEKSSFERKKVSGLTKEEFIILLEIFSYITMIENKLVYDKPYLYTKLNYIKSKKNKLSFDNDKLLDDLKSAICILVEDGLEYTFPHKSLQEYFAALFISKLGLESKLKFYEKTLSYFTKPTGNIVFPYANFYSLLMELDYKVIIEVVILNYFKWFKKQLLISLQNNSTEDFSRLYSVLSPNYRFFLNMHKFNFIVPQPGFLIEDMGSASIGQKHNYQIKIKEKIDLIQNVMEQIVKEIDESNIEEFEILDLK